MYHNRCEYLIQCGIDPEEDDCLALMKDEIERYLDTPVGEILKQQKTYHTSHSLNSGNTTKESEYING
jgi:hypothetical protein